MVTYASSIPHLFLEEIFDVTEVLPILEASKNSKQPISLFSIILKAFSMAISEHPRINTIYSTKSQFQFNTAS
jgi:pyruvate/2-oxoglutarate dehydrogenase complex dihydrolipoamide acyltransferase (E2) component